MSKAIIRVPVADLRARPEHRSERVSQVLFGQPVELQAEQGDFLHVLCEDRYEGWVAASYCAAAPDCEYATATIKSNFARVKQQGVEYLLSYGARLCLDDSGVLRSPVDGSRLELLSGDLAPGDAVATTDLLELALQFLGVPYLWGGVSTFGFDCSGLTQTLFRSRGLLLPRDSKDQALYGREKTLEEALPGDLLFWPGHVAIYVGELRIIHATRLRGMVVQESLDPDQPTYRVDLAASIKTIRRIEAEA